MAVDQHQIILPVREPKELSKPLTFWLPEEYKSADFNAKQGLITAYLTIYNDPSTGQPFVDPYMDVVVPGSFSKTINELSSARNRKNTPYLCADLWQHDRREPIGGIKGLTEDSKGVIYEAQLLMSVQRAREAFELAAAKMIGSSYGYDPIRFEHKGDLRHLIEIRLHEVSQVTFPANDIAPIIDTKDAENGNKTTHFVPSTLPAFPDLPDLEEYTAEFDEELFAIKAVIGSTGLSIGPRDESWDAGKARGQYKQWGTDGDGKPIPSKYKQVHLELDGDPSLLGSYKYPFCYIVDGKPQISVGGVKAAYGAAKGARGAGENSAILSKIATMYNRINAKYPDAPKLTVEKGWEYMFEWKQDFTTAWTQKLPSQLMTQFFRMCDTLTYVMLQNFQDDDVTDQNSAIDTCLSQFGDVVKEWLTDYQAADDAQDALGDDDGDNGNGDSNSVMPMGFYSADMSSINLKRAVEDFEKKAGRTLSDASKKRLQEIANSISTYLDQLHTFIGDTEIRDITDLVEIVGMSDDTRDDTGKSSQPSSEYTHSITQGLTVLGTLAPSSAASLLPPDKKQQAASMFPMLADYSGQEVDITDLLRSIQTVMKNGGTR